MPGVERCSDCGTRRLGMYLFWQPEKEDWQPCSDCAALRRGKISVELESKRAAAKVDKANADKAALAVKEAEAEMKLDIMRKEQFEQEKQRENVFARQEKRARAKEMHEKNMREKSIELERQKIALQEKNIEEKQIDFEREKIAEQMRKIEMESKLKLAQEETKQREAKARAEEASSLRDQVTAQERTKQVKIENRELTKQVQEEERTKRIKAANELVMSCAELGKVLSSAGTDREHMEDMIRGFLDSLGGILKQPEHAEPDYLEKIDQNNFSALSI